MKRRVEVLNMRDMTHTELVVSRRLLLIVLLCSFNFCLYAQTTTSESLIIRAYNSNYTSRAVLYLGNPNNRKNIERMFSNDNQAVPQIYILNGVQKNEIQYLSDPSQSFVIPIGIRMGVYGTFTLQFEKINTLPITSLILKDKVLQLEVDLLVNQDSEGKYVYEYEHSTGNLDNRFELIINLLNLMYWRKDATNNNWNDPDNWVKEDGTPFEFSVTPLKCTVVHIPGNASYYPSLDEVSTPRIAYNDGKPSCADIIYHFGSEVAKPHYLDYNRAFVQYNFGRNINESDQMHFSCGDVSSDASGTHSAPFMSRDRYYAVAVPLKQIVTGDFSVGGYPLMWQQGFKTSRVESSDNEAKADWYLPNNKMGLEIGAAMNYAVSLKAGGYDATVVGKSDHKYLNGLKGVFELPYFEQSEEVVVPTSESACTNHRLHWYVANPLSPGSGTSYFAYYYEKDLRMADLGKYKDPYPRSQQAYRFVFEDNDNKPIENFEVSVPADGENEVMIGNPFVSSLDLKEFFRVNAGKVEDYYRLYLGGQFEVPNESETDDYGVVAPLQAFFIKPVEGSIPAGGNQKEIKLIFTEAMSVNRASGSVHPLRSSSPVTGVLTVRATNAAGSTRALIAFDNSRGKNSINRLFSNDAPSVPQLYIKDGEQKNEIQYLSDLSQPVTLPLGIRSNWGGRFELRFENRENLPVHSLILIDKELQNKEIDLMADDNNRVYAFENSTGNLENRFELVIGRRDIPTGIIPSDPEQIRIYVQSPYLCVDAGKEIREIQVLTATGSILMKETLSGSFQFRKILKAVPGIYLVKVKLKDGALRTEKIRMN